MKIREMFSALAMLIIAAPAWAIEPFPASFKPQTIKTNGTELYVRTGGQGPVVMLLYGFGGSGDMWSPIAAKPAAG